jgi:hypothetical protein
MNNPFRSHQTLHEDSNKISFLKSILIVICLLSFYSLTYSGTFRVDDEHILAARAQSFAFRGHLDYPQIYGNDRVRHLSETLEDSADPTVAIEPGQAILGSLPFRFASLLDLDGVQAFFTINLYATALTGVLVFWIVQGLGFRSITAMATSLVFGVGTMAWPFSKTAFRDPLAMMFLTLGFLGWVLLLRKKRLRFLGIGFVLVGISCGILVKSNVLLVIPAFLLSSLLLPQERQKAENPSRKWLLFPSLILTLIFLFIAIWLPKLGPISRLSLSNYFGLIRRYMQGINGQTFLAMVGPFVSPTKSIFLFNPVLILIPLVIGTAWKGMRSFVLPTLLTTFFFVLAQALHLGALWAGTLVWGLRFLLPCLPMLTILIAPAIDNLWEEEWSWRGILTIILICTALLVQLGGAIVAWGIPFEEWHNADLYAYNTEAIWNPNYQVIPIHLRHLIDPASWDIAWIRILLENPVGIIVPLVLGFCVVASLLGLGWLRFPRRSKIYSYTVFSILVVVILLFPIIPSLWLYKMDPWIGGQQQEFKSLNSWTEGQLEAGDLVLVDSYGTRLWRSVIGDWDAAWPWYSLPYEIPGAKGVGWTVGDSPSTATLDLFSRVGTNFSRIIYLTSDETPDYSLLREILWLQERFTQVGSVVFHGSVKTQGLIFIP